MEYNCPSCGAPIHYRSSVSVYTTCVHCNSNVVRKDMDLSVMGEKSKLLQDMSPFQVGTSGQYEGRSFTLWGRLKIMYKHGTWSEWYAIFDDGSEGWLAEAQGFYMMSFKEMDSPTIPEPSQLEVGIKWQYKDVVYKVDDRREIIYGASEGELPFIFQEGFKSVSVDLRSNTGLYASILYGPEEEELFIGKYLPFEAFKFDNLRTLDGWRIG